MAQVFNREANSALRSCLVGARCTCLPIASTSCAGLVSTAKRSFTLSAFNSRQHGLQSRKSHRLAPQVPLVRSASERTLQAAASSTSARCCNGQGSKPTKERRGAHTSRENTPQQSSERASELEHQLMNLPLVQELLGSQTSSGIGSQHSSSRFIATRPYDTFPPSKLETHMTAGQLRGPGGFAISPLALIRADFGQTRVGAEGEAEHTSGGEADAHVIYHLGRFLCGHEGIVHGGLLATICDEALAIIGFRHFQSKVGVTVRLEIDYRSPAVPDHFVGVQVRLIRDQSSPKKAVVVGTMRDLQTGKVLVDAKAIFVEPRDARLNASLAGSPNASRP